MRSALNAQSIDRELDDNGGSFLTKSVPHVLRHKMALHYVGCGFWEVPTIAAGVAQTSASTAKSALIA